MNQIMQTIIERERSKAEVVRSQQGAVNIWNSGQHNLEEIAEIRLLSLDQVREAISGNGRKMD